MKHISVVFVALFDVAHLVVGMPQGYGNYSFEQYITDFQKFYNSVEEKALRQVAFANNLKRIATQNALFEAKRSSWFMGVNQFTDMSPQEFVQWVSKGYRKELSEKDAYPQISMTRNGSNPDSIDWRTKNVVTPPKDQGGCGSCWAFAAAETVESHYAISSGTLLTLAPQAYVNCVKNPKGCGGSGGCNGATAELAFDLTKKRGIPLEKSLPYKGKGGWCSGYSAAVKVNGYVKLAENDANAVETAVASKGPLSISVAAGMWQLYRGGIFDGCTNNPITPEIGSDLNHAVQMVGYGIEKGQGYWLIRNSWGAKYGEDGYIRVTRKNDGKTYADKTPEHGVACKPYPSVQNVGGECGVLFDTAYPTGVTATAKTDFFV